MNNYLTILQSTYITILKQHCLASEVFFLLKVVVHCTCFDCCPAFMLPISVFLSREVSPVLFR